MQEVTFHFLMIDTQHIVDFNFKNRGFPNKLQYPLNILMPSLPTTGAPWSFGSKQLDCSWPYSFWRSQTDDEWRLFVDYSTGTSSICQNMKMLLYISISVCRNISIYLSIYLSIYTYICMYIHWYVCIMYLCVCVCVRACVRTCVRTSEHTYVCIYLILYNRI